MAKYTYAEIEKDLPIIVRAELQKQDDTQRQIFAEEFGKKRRTIFHCYGFLILFSAHRWYLGKPWMTVLQWITIACGGIGLIWVFVDLFLVPGMRRDRNPELSKGILAEQKIISGGYTSYHAGGIQQPHHTTINVTNSQ